MSEVFLGQYHLRRAGERRSCFFLTQSTSDAETSVRPSQCPVYTPTENIPNKHIGSGPLDITLPVAFPDYTDFFEIPAYRSPRFWVDLIQRQTGKLRWTPISPATVEFVRYDCFSIRADHLALGTKALLDALKIRTSGRRDRLYLHYFGAIVDDSYRFVNVFWGQELVEHPKDARVRAKIF